MLGLPANIAMWSFEIAVAIHAFQEYFVSRKLTQFLANLVRLDLLVTGKYAQVGW